jgi:uncharacterized protein DUF1206
MSSSTNLNREINHLKQEGKRAVTRPTTSPLIENLTRLGYIVRGLIYAVIGILAFQAAMTRGGAITDPQGAIATLGRTPFGAVLLYAVFIGLIGYALWGLIRAIFDPLLKGETLKGIAQRISFLISGVSYGLLALATWGLINGATNAARSGGQVAQGRQIAATILAQPWGPAAVILIGLIVVGNGIYQFSQGLRANFEQQFQPYVLSTTDRTLFVRLGRFGTAARGVVFVLIGIFLVLAAVTHNPSQVQGFDGVLLALLRQPYGPWMLGVVALGLIAFGIYSAMTGFWLRMRR